MNRVSWGKDQADINYVGIQCLLDEGVYKAAYPLHDVSNHVFSYFQFASMLQTNPHFNTIYILQYPHIIELIIDVAF